MENLTLLYILFSLAIFSINSQHKEIKLFDFVFVENDSVILK